MFNTSQNNNYIFVCQTLSQSANWGTKGYKFKTVLINSSQENHITCTIHFYRRFFPKKCKILLLALPSSFTCIKKFLIYCIYKKNVIKISFYIPAWYVINQKDFRK